MTQTEPAPAVTRPADGSRAPGPGRWQIDPGHTELAFIDRRSPTAGCTPRVMTAARKARIAARGAVTSPAANPQRTCGKHAATMPNRAARAAVPDVEDGWRRRP
jgi:hypothetical protein